MTVEEIREKILTGKAILFCGAGFSYGSKNILDETPPTASSLSKKISQLGGFKESENLRFTSDKYINDNKQDLTKLIDLLFNNFSIKETSEAQNNIISYPWRRIYTTNYDDTIEVAGKKTGKHIDCICIDDSSKDFFSRNNICVHINGYINGLTEEKLMNGYLKLSKASYFSSNSFENSNWYYTFKKDLMNANLIVFIGYSMYDIEIEKILFNGAYKDKTCFINAPKEYEETLYTLNQYGSVLTSGTDVFGMELSPFDKSTTIAIPINFNSLYQYQIQESDEIISDTEINNFIMQGDIKNEYLNLNYIEKYKKPYIIKRRQLNDVVDKIKNNNNIVIYSEFGNGKTIFLEQLKSKLVLDGKSVYYTKTVSEYLNNDFDLLCSNHKDFILVIDSYSKYLDFIDYVLSVNNPHVILVLADNSGLHERNFKRLELSCHETYNYTLNKLNDDELKIMTAIISNIGFWKERVKYSDEANINYLKEKCSAELSSILLGIFESPQMRSRVSELFVTLNNRDSYKRTVLSICLLKMMDISIDEALISEMANNSEIYNPKFVNNPDFKTLFPSQTGEINVKSSLFASSLIKTCFERIFIRDCLLHIAKRFDELKHNGGYIEESIFKSVVKFSFIERLFPEKDKRAILVSYYDSLKTEVIWLQKDPHYWLQYGMAELNFKNIQKCEQYLKNSYELAKAKPGYDTIDIDTQYARLLLLKSFSESDGKKIMSLFSEANNLLINLPNDYYRIRQVYLYKDFYDKKFKFLGEKEKTKFIDACKIMHKTIIDYEQTSIIRDKNLLSHKLLDFFEQLNELNIK